MKNFREYVASLLPRPFANELSAGWFGVLNGLTGDLLAQGMTIAARMAWLKDRNSPPDVLPFLANERGLPSYPGENETSHRSRLVKAWDTYQEAGAALSIETQFAVYGYPGKVAFFPSKSGPKGEPAPYWSQFWMRFPVGTHPITSEGPQWDSFTWDDGSVWGPVGYTPEFAAAIRNIVSQWKPVDWVCRGFIFELGTSTWDTFNWDDGTLWNGAVEIDF